MLTLIFIVGDFIFQSSRRTYTQDASAAGIRVFAYYFTDPDAIAPSNLFPSLIDNPLAPGSLGDTSCFAVL